jgi:Flp pilus assembly pilin Flp
MGRELFSRAVSGYSDGASSPLGSDGGQTLTEYALILALVALVVVGAVGFFSGRLDAAYSYIGSNMP